METCLSQILNSITWRRSIKIFPSVRFRNEGKNTESWCADREAEAAPVLQGHSDVGQPDVPFVEVRIANGACEISPEPQPEAQSTPRIWNECAENIASNQIYREIKTCFSYVLLSDGTSFVSPGLDIVHHLSFILNFYNRQQPPQVPKKIDVLKVKREEKGTEAQNRFLA